MTQNSSHRAVWRKAIGLEEAKLKPFSQVCLHHIVNRDSRCGPLRSPALLAPVAIAEENVFAAILSPIVRPWTTVVAIEGGPDLTWSMVGLMSGYIRHQLMGSL